MGKIIVFLYGIVCYAVFFLSFLYAIGFVGNLVVPKSIDSGTAGAIVPSLVVNLVLLALFAVQHSVMARPAFKRWWTRIVPVAAERSTYVLISSLLLFLLYFQWRPMTGVVWNIESGLGAGVITAIFWVGWLIVLLSTFMINHFDLFGLRQVYLNFRGDDYHDPKFTTRGLYKCVRHPIMLGFIIAFWATPQMTVGHLVFSIMTSAYIVVGVLFEENDLKNALGQDYEDYQGRVSMLIPGCCKKRKT